MGRSPASGWLLLRQLGHAGLRTTSFGYSVSRESFAQIAGRLAARVGSLLPDGKLVLVGHSLGGVLLRHALSALGPDARRVHHLFLLGSPVQASSAAIRLGRNPVFRFATRDCGQLLGSSERMAAVGVPQVPTTGIAGTRAIVGMRGPFGMAQNDGIVSLPEVSADWLKDQVLVPVVHTLLPASRKVGEVIVQRLLQRGA